MVWRRLPAVVLLAALCLAARGAAAQVDAASNCTYTIKLGDTLSAVAEIHRTDLGTLANLNPQADPASLDVGQIVTVPCNGVTVCTHTLKLGDTLSSVAFMYDIETPELESLNPGVAAAGLRVDQLLNVPCGGPSNCTYTVVAGDTLSAIAETRGTDTDTILALNPGVDATMLFVGQGLKMPCNDTRTATDTCTYTIKAGNTLSGIADAYGTDLAAIEAVNPGLNATTLQLDQVIVVPCNLTANATKTCTYTIKAGNTLNTIADAYDTDSAALEALNPGLDATILQLDQVINVPCTDPEHCSYTVKAGDTLNIIAGVAESDLETVESLNPGLDPTKLQIGQTLWVPCAASSSTTKSRKLLR